MRFKPPLSNVLICCIYCLVALCFSTGLNAQTDDKFWFVAPEVAHSNLGLDAPVYIRLSSGNSPASVVIKKPADNSFTPINVSLGAYQSKTVDMTPFLNSIENRPPNMVLNNGLLIESTTPITCYYEVSSQLNPDIFALKGENALGTEFYIASQNTWRNSPNYSPTPYSAFDIVATEDTTKVTITPSNALVGHSANIPFTITLHKGQTYSAASVPAAFANQQLGGSLVTATKPVAITMKHDLLAGHTGCADLAGDQLIPTNSIGREYVVTRGFLGPENEYIFVWGAKTNCTITVHTTGSSYTVNLASGAVHSIQVVAERYYITSTSPVYVIHFTGFGCEIGAAVLPSVCSGSNEVAFTRSTDENFGLIITCRDIHKNSFKLNGSNTLVPAGSFDYVPGTANKWVSARINFTPAQIPQGTNVRLQNDLGLFHVGIINGGTTSGCRYGFFSNFTKFGFAEQPVDVSADYCDTNYFRVKMNDSVTQFVYQWYFNNVPISGANSNVLIIPKADKKDVGNYYCIVTEGCFEVQSNTVKLAFANKPVPAFKISNYNPCLNESDTFTNTTSPGYFSQKWVFEDGDTAGDSVAIRAYSSTGQKTGKLILTHLKGCKDSATQIITVRPLPNAAYSVDDTAQCRRDNSFSFTNASSIPTGALTYKWELGNRDTAVTSNITYTYITDSVYTVTLIATSDYQCRDTAQSSLYVYPMPKAAFTINDSNQCFKTNNFVYTNNSTVKSGSMSYQWDLGDGSSTSSLNTQRKYSTDGVFTVTLKAVTDKLCSDSVQKNISIITSNPKADFDFDKQFACFATQAFNFTNKSSVSNGSSQLLWKMGDGAEMGVVPQNYSYNAPGIYTVTQVILGDSGCTDSIKKNIHVFNQPVSGFTIDNDSQCLNTNSFTIQSTAVINNDTITSRVWSLEYGPGFPGNASVQHSYTQPGNYIIKEILGTNKGCFDSSQKAVTVFPVPQAGFLCDTPCLHRPTQFADTSLTNNTMIISGWKWDFGDTTGDTIQNPEHYYKNPGIYNVSLIITSTDGCRDTSVIPGAALVRPLPVAWFGFTFTGNGYEEKEVQFTDSSTDAIKWNWSFDNMYFVSLQHPAIWYKDTGWKYIYLEVQNTEGCDSAVVRYIYVPPEIDYYLPNAFTPGDEDKLNPAFGIEGKIYYKRFLMRIFNRWGEVLFESDDPVRKWDGNFKGEACPTDVYFYLIEIVDVNSKWFIKRGPINLIR